MKFKKVLLLALLCSSVLVGCEEHPSFKTSVDAVEGCKKELAELKEMDDVSVENLAKATSVWLEIQDSAYSVFSRDTTINLRSPVAMAYLLCRILYVENSKDWRLPILVLFVMSCILN